MPGVYPALISMAAAVSGGGSPPAALHPAALLPLALSGLCGARLRHPGQSNVTSQGVAAG